MVLIMLGSKNDEKYLEGCLQILKRFEISYVVKVASAHRSPDRVVSLINEWESKTKVIIAMAGHAAHLAGVIAGHTYLPVVAVPLPSSDLKGFDSLLSSVQMPPGVPVAVMAIGEAGSQNAAYFSLQILSLQDKSLQKKYLDFKKSLSEKVEKDSLELEKKC